MRSGWLSPLQQPYPRGLGLGLCYVYITEREQVGDNVRVARTESTVSGLQFTVGTHPVTYTVTDRAGLQSSCTFNVQVRQLAGQLELGRFTLLFTLFGHVCQVGFRFTFRFIFRFENAQL